MVGFPLLLLMDEILHQLLHMKPYQKWYILHMGVSKNRDTPKWMVKIMENPIFYWMIWGENPLFLLAQVCRRSNLSTSQRIRLFGIVTSSMIRASSVAQICPPSKGKELKHGEFSSTNWGNGSMSSMANAMQILYIPFESFDVHKHVFCYLLLKHLLNSWESSWHVM